MRKLLVISDDFTGALDTGVQFSSYNVSLKVFTHPSVEFDTLDRNIDVLIVNAETRHLKPSVAYDIVYKIAADAFAHGFSFICKKVDSGLRGNIGSELSAVLDATGIENLQFIPAYPRLNRVTKNGIHYVNDLPLHMSIIAEDPFEPPRYSDVKKIISSQTDAKIASSEGDSGIHIFNAATDNDLEQIADSLSLSDLTLSSGSAGFAPYLAKKLGYSPIKKMPPALNRSKLVICGSVNPVSRDQMIAIEGQGFKRYQLSPQQKIEEGWIDSPECSAFVTSCIKSIESDGAAVIDVNGDNFVQSELPEDSVREHIAMLLGKLCRKILDINHDIDLISIGGDTLKAIIDTLHVSEITPAAELEPGVVLNRIEYCGEPVSIVSKSGSFGSENTILNLIKSIGDGVKYAE